MPRAGADLEELGGIAERAVDVCTSVHDDRRTIDIAFVPGG